MKTAGQEFLEWYNKYVKDNGCCPSNYDINYFWNAGNLEKEKQQIIDAFNQGFREGETETMVADTQKDVSEYDDAINYYNETYK